MGARKNFNKEEFINFLNMIYKNLNLENKDYIQFLIDTYYTDNMHGTYYLKTCMNQFHNFPGSKTAGASNHIKYWINRGWSNDQAKQKIRDIHKEQEIFFDKNEIFDYIITTGCGNFNVNNPKFIREFVEYIQFDDFLYSYQIMVWLGKWSNKFYDTHKAGFVTTKKEYWLARGYDEEETSRIISQSQKERCPRTIEYHQKRGLSEEEAKNEVSKLQRHYANRSKSTYEYWSALGLPDEEIKQKVKYYNDLRSVWGKTHWEYLGYTEEEAAEIVKYYNASCPECFKYEGEYANYVEAIKKFRENHKKIWRNIKNNKDLSKIKGGCISHISKAEQECFSFLNKHIDSSIEHTPYIVIFPDGYESPIGNTVFYACDGFLKYKDSYIVIEFDGGIGIYHHEENDQKRDNDILCLDDNVLGILRIQDNFFKYKDIQIKIQKINEALTQIKECRSDRVILKYE